LREIVVDTETTGLDPLSGHRVVEIGCVELLNHIPTGVSYQTYIDPERDMPEEAFRVHNLSSEFLRGKPLFADIAQEFLVFIGDAKLVAHNGGFDFNFLNAELERIGRPIIARERLVDTLSLARRRNPGGANRLDDLCDRYGIDRSRRTAHGALLDAELLAEIYVEMMGGRQASLGFAAAAAAANALAAAERGVRVREIPLVVRLSAAEEEAHRAFIASLGGTPLWDSYLPPETAPENAVAAE